MQINIADCRDCFGWKWERLSFVLPSCIKDKIRAIPFQEFGIGEDLLLWKCTKDGDFTTTSAYLSVEDDFDVEDTFKGSWIWKLDLLPKIKSFFWLCLHNSAPIRRVLASKGMNCNPLCPLYRN